MRINDIVVSKFFINAFTSLVLFDTGALHSFVDKYKLPTVALKSAMLVSSPGEEYMSSSGCYQLPVTIGRHVFPTDLIILESEGLRETSIAPVNQFYSPPRKERGSSMYLGMRRGGLK